MKNIICMSLIIQFNSLLSLGQGYCIPTFAAGTYFIDNFAFHTLVNTYSGINANEYVFYSPVQFTTTVTIGETYPISISDEYPAGSYGKFAAWLDYNNDSIFDGTELIHYDAISLHSTSGFVNIPNNNNFIGQRRLRVIYTFGTPLDTSCGSFTNGECEDYLINIVPSQPDSQTYCIPFTPIGMDNFNIDDFHLHTMQNNNSGSNITNYVLYPQDSFSVNLFLNNSYPVYIYKGTSAGNTGGYGVWIDLDDDGEFTVAEQLFMAGPGLTSASGMITIPNDTSFIGVRRLRVRSKWANIPTNPCGLMSGSETEDYMINILGNPTSINNLNLNEVTLSVYPNPSSGTVNIKSESMINEIKIIDSIGKLMYYSRPNQNQIALNIPNSGIYFFTMSSLSKTITYKVIIEK